MSIAEPGSTLVTSERAGTPGVDEDAFQTSRKWLFRKECCLHKTLPATACAMPSANPEAKNSPSSCQKKSKSVPQTSLNIIDFTGLHRETKEMRAAYLHGENPLNRHLCSPSEPFLENSHHSFSSLSSFPQWPLKSPPLPKDSGTYKFYKYGLETQKSYYKWSLY